jgi:hypothetical protein
MDWYDHHPRDSGNHSNSKILQILYQVTSIPVTHARQSSRHEEANEERHYQVSPDTWYDLKKSENDGGLIASDTIMVNHGNSASSVDWTPFRIARIHEIRVFSDGNTLLLINWFYWPDELPQGRLPYHGASEVIDSDHYDIMDARTVAGSFKIQKWNENDDEAVLEDMFCKEFYKTGEGQGRLSSLRKYCDCQGYYNPDKVMVQCNGCRTWLHTECLESKALRLCRGSSVKWDEEEQAVVVQYRPDQFEHRKVNCLFCGDEVD